MAGELHTRGSPGHEHESGSGSGHGHWRGDHSGEHESAGDSLDLKEELKSLQRVVEAYVNYPFAAEAFVRRWEQSYFWLPEKHKALLDHFPRKIAKARRCIAANAEFISEMLQAFEPPFELPPGLLETLEGVGDHSGWHTFPHMQDHSPNAPSDTREKGQCLKRDPRFGEGSREPKTEDSLHHCVGQPGSSASQPTHRRTCPDPFIGQKEAVFQDAPEPVTLGAPGSNGDRNVLLSTQHVPRVQASTQLPGVQQSVQVLPPPWLPGDPSYLVPPADAEKVRCVLRSVVREWAEEGARERAESFGPILRELKRKFGDRLTGFWGDFHALKNKSSAKRGSSGEAELAAHAHSEVGEACPSRESGNTTAEACPPPSCLVPGAGLGRLPLEICQLGFSCQGNEFSFYTLICSHCLLNCASSAGQWIIFPWVLSSCNNLSDSHQLEPVLIPDVLPTIPSLMDERNPESSPLPPPGLDFSMCAGDFVEVYSHPSQEGAWDSVATCFFLDTAHNVIEYIEVIWKVLRPGGVWVNVGPLLYHFSDASHTPPGSSEEEKRRTEMSLELSLEDVREIALKVGFRLDKEEFITTTYSAHEKSMMRNQYTCVLWTMVKS